MDGEAEETSQGAFRYVSEAKETYSLVCSKRQIYADKTLTREDAKGKLHKWYDKVAACTLREMKSARDAIKGKGGRSPQLLHLQVSQCRCRITQLRMKGFRTEIRCVEDLPFFMFRPAMIFG